MKKIKKIMAIHKFADDTYVEYSDYPDYNFDIGHPVFLYEHKRKSNLIEYKKKIIYEDDTFFIPPTTSNILPINNGLEFLCIYGKEPGEFNTVKQPPWHFPPPNNAAIYYSDGTLKHQLISPIQDDGWYIDRTWYMDYPEGTWQSKYNGFGFIVANDSRYPQGAFCLYDSTPNLVLTSYEIDRSR